MQMYPRISAVSGTFSIFIEPEEILVRELDELIEHHRGKILYLSGNYPQILMELSRYSERFETRRAMTVYQILTILDEVYHSLVIFEHDRSLYDDNSELMEEIGHALRETAELSATVVMVARRADRWLLQLEPFAHRFIYVTEPVIITRKAGKRQISRDRQMVLDSEWALRAPVLMASSHPSPIFSSGSETDHVSL